MYNQIGEKPRFRYRPVSGPRIYQILTASESELLSSNVSKPHSDQSGANSRPDQSAAIDTRALAVRLSPLLKAYGANTKRSLLQLALTIIPFFALLIIMAVAAAQHIYWLSLLLAAPTAGLLVRLFIFQHDCGHGAYFPSRTANDILGRFISVLTFTPYDQWKRSHAYHHAASGDLDRRGQGDVVVMTTREYQAAPRFKRLGYRLYRNPIIMIALGAPVNFLLLQRIPLGRAFRDRPSMRSIMGLNLALLIAFGLPIAMIGVWPVLTAYLPMLIIAAWIGGWLFYIQHQFEGTYWERGENWNFHQAAIESSSYFVLPPVLRWFTGNIGLHHIHHLCSKIPNYRLQACLDAFPELRDVARRITLRGSLKCWRLALWDEDRRRLVSFREYGRQKLHSK
jgi:acyl-lipid omega-6 desaturase (Delta-12 desaturase)